MPPTADIHLHLNSVCSGALSVGANDPDGISVGTFDTVACTVGTDVSIVGVFVGTFIGSIDSIGRVIVGVSVSMIIDGKMDGDLEGGLVSCSSCNGSVNSGSIIWVVVGELVPSMMIGLYQVKGVVGELVLSVTIGDSERGAYDGASSSL